MALNQTRDVHNYIAAMLCEFESDFRRNRGQGSAERRHFRLFRCPRQFRRHSRHRKFLRENRSFLAPNCQADPQSHFQRSNSGKSHFFGLILAFCSRNTGH